MIGTGLIGHIPWPIDFSVPTAKITRFLLDPNSIDGGPKSRYLMSYGFDPSRPAELDRALRNHARFDLFCGIKVVQGGLKYLFDGPMPAPNGRDAALVTVWQLDHGAAEARFITARPSRR